MTLLFAVPAADAAAQRGGGGRPGQGNRQQLEQRLRQRLGTLLKTQLGLDDQQMRQLSEVNQRFDVRRRALVQREFQNRRALRTEVMRKDSADAARIDGYLAEQFRIERERIDLTEAEQRDLAAFLTPLQRAQYLGVQEQIRREMDQLRGRGMQPMGMNPPPDSVRGRRRPPAVSD
jgi:Spy/CpxP family protein refolding chaperone